jgi:hypothetical protein
MRGPLYSGAMPPDYDLEPDPAEIGRTMSRDVRPVNVDPARDGQHPAEVLARLPVPVTPRGSQQRPRRSLTTTPSPRAPGPSETRQGPTRQGPPSAAPLSWW